jgi:hypothetical protein
MALVDDIAAINARVDIDQPEKRRLIRELKANAHKLNFDQLPGRTFTVGGGASRITVTFNWLWVSPEGDLYLDLTITTGTNPQVPLVFENPLIIRNCPILVPDGSGGFREDIIAAGRQMLIDFVASRRA